MTTKVLIKGSFKKPTVNVYSNHKLVWSKKCLSAIHADQVRNEILTILKGGKHE